MLNLRLLLRNNPTLISIEQNGFKRLTNTKRFFTRQQLSASDARVWKSPPLTLAPALQQQRNRLFASTTTTKTTNADGSDNETQIKRVYYGSLAPRMKAVKVFSLTTSLVGVAAQPVLMEQGTKLGGTALAVLFCGCAGFFTFVTPLLLHFITKKYVTEIHYDPVKDEYTATTISIFLHKIKTNFQPSDVKVPEVPGMFTSFLVRGKPLLVDPSQFEDPEHYVRIMGYDKPVDFKLNMSESDVKPVETTIKNKE